MQPNMYPVSSLFRELLGVPTLERRSTWRLRCEFIDVKHTVQRSSVPSIWWCHSSGISSRFWRDTVSKASKSTVKEGTGKNGNGKMETKS